MVAWFLIHLVAKIAVPQALDIDAAEQAYFAQALHMGYGVRQPPLYTWVVWLLGQTGLPMAVALEALRYAVLAAWFAGVWAVLRQLGWSPAVLGWAWLAHLGLAVVMWTAHDSLTHTALAAVLTVWAAAHLLTLLASDAARPATARAATVGVLAGLAVLSKFNAALWLASALAATLLVPQARARLAWRHVAAGAAATAIVVLPYAGWWLSQPVSAAQLARQITVIAQPAPSVAESAGPAASAALTTGAGSGAPGHQWADVLGEVLEGALFNVIVSGLLVALVAGRAAWAATVRDWRWRWLAVQAGVALVVTGALLLASGADVFKGRWLWPVMPLAALVLLWPLSRLQRAGNAGGLPRRVVAVLVLAVALSFIAAAARLIEPRVHAPRCKQCWTERDTDAMARVLHARWGDGRLIVTAEHHLAGSLAAARPPLRAFMAGGPPGLPPPPRPGRYGGCAAAWVGEAVPPPLTPLLDARDRPQSWSWPMPHAPQRRIRLSTQAISSEACAAWAAP